MKKNLRAVTPPDLVLPNFTANISVCWSSNY